MRSQACLSEGDVLIIGLRQRLLLDSRVVDVPRSSHRIVVTLSSLKPFFCNGLQKALPFSDTVRAEAPGIQ